MLTTKNSEIMKKYIEAVLIVSSKKTSRSYSKIMANTIISRLCQKHPFLKGITFKMTSFSSGTREISLSGDIDEVDQKKIGEAISDITSALTKSMADSKDLFIKELKGYIGQEYELKMKNIGVVF